MRDGKYAGAPNDKYAALKHACAKLHAAKDHAAAAHIHMRDPLRHAPELLQPLHRCSLLRRSRRMDCQNSKLLPSLFTMQHVDMPAPLPL